MQVLRKHFHSPPDVYAAIRPLFSACCYFGLAPYSLKRDRGKPTFKFSVPPALWTGLLAALLLGSLTYHVISDFTPFKDSDLKQKLTYFQELFSSLLSAAAVILSCLFAVKIIQVFKNIETVDVAFRALAVWVPYKNLYIGIILNLVGLVVLVLVLSLNYYFLAPFQYRDRLYSFFITCITIILPYFINLLMELQYCQYLNILRTRYKLLNEYLESLVQETPNAIDGWAEKTSKGAFLKKSARNTSKSVLAVSDPIYIVDQAAALHIKLTDTAHMINFAFCVQQLLRITVAFISIVTALFFIAINFNTPESQKEVKKIQLDYFFTFWAFSNACEVMAIVWVTSETCEEANTCPRILHKIRNNTNNIDLQETIEIYSLQMYHNRLSFTVCGLFPLDYTLLYTIVAGVTTYLVILIQFNNADFPTNNNNTAAQEVLNTTHN